MNRGAVAQSVLVAVGVWLMAAPSALGHAGTPVGSSDRVVGPVVIAVAFLAIFTITRGARWVNYLPGTWLLVAPWVLDGATTATRVSDVASGLVILALAWVEDVDMSRYGGGWKTLWQPEKLPAADVDRDSR